MYWLLKPYDKLLWQEMVPEPYWVSKKFDAVYQLNKHLHSLFGTVKHIFINILITTVEPRLFKQWLTELLSAQSTLLQ